jgi:NAD(P) transhydrogenase subunit alpha
MIVGVTSETFPGERRVALVPTILPSLTKAGFEILIESGAGNQAGFPDAEYVERGARIATSRAEVFAQADVVFQVRAYGANPEHGSGDLDLLRKGQVLFGLFEPLTSVDAVRAVAGTGASLFAMELIPRITRAQSMDVLSSMATIAGYKGVLMAAEHLPKMFPMMMTAAGTIKPAKVLVVGAGVAGLQAIASARRLGAQVEAYDLRPAVKEQIESLGAKFIEMELDTAAAEDKGGYAKEMNEDFYRRQRELMTRVVAEQDVVITTAAVPGKKAPVLITAEMVRGMQTGSVIVDLAAERGGNCELTRPDEVVVEQGVTILGPANLAARVPYHASQMYAKNLATLLLHLVGKKAKDDPEVRLELSGDDEILRGTLVTHQGEVVHTQILETLGATGATAGKA